MNSTSGDYFKLLSLSDSFDDVGEDGRYNRKMALYNFSLSYSNWSETVDVFQETLLEFKYFWNRLLSVYQPLEIIVLFIGLLGNILALTTLIRSSKMRTPSFVYHRALVGTDLAFCVNFFLNAITDRWFTVDKAGCQNEEEGQYVFRYWLAAFYSGTLHWAINNTCGWLIIYMTLIIALDRTLALLFFKSYHIWNHRHVALSVVGLTFILSVSFHSWHCFVQRSILTYRLHVDEYPLFIEPCWNESIVYHWVNRENISETYKKAIKAKNGYNGGLRIVYPIMLSLLTIAVFYGLMRRHRLRKRNRSRIGATFLSTYHHGEASVSITATSFAVPANSCGSPTGARIRQRVSKVGCEKMLFLLMIAVVVLAFIQVSAGETSRILQLLFPPDVLIRDKIANQALAMEERLSLFRLILYGHQISRLVAKFCTAIDRSCICILYMAMNKLFRREVLALLRRLWRCCGDGIVSAYDRLDSRRRNRLNEIDSTNANAFGNRNSANAYLHVPSSPMYPSSPTERSFYT